MADVFWCATRVVVWLGEATSSSDFAFEILRDIDSKVDYDITTFVFVSKPGMSSEVSTKLPPGTFITDRSCVRSHNIC